MPDGFAVVDKQAGWTSHDVVARARKVIGERRVGHAGTLDPDATGVLLLGVGRATRLLRFLTALPKTYTAEVVFGRETSTLDASGETTATYEMQVEPAQVLAAAATLTGPIMQVPPMVSALKVDGRRLHELAREGIEVEREPRPVTVHRFDVDSTPDPLVYRVEVECSSGTYVRSPCRRPRARARRWRVPPDAPSHRGRIVRGARSAAGRLSAAATGRGGVARLPERGRSTPPPPSRSVTARCWRVTCSESTVMARGPWSTRRASCSRCTSRRRRPMS